jgi:hypothetical protein
MRLASLAICLVVIASFALFVVNQTSSASARQQGLVNAAAPSAVPAAPSANPTAAQGTSSKSSPAQESSLRRAVDDAANAFTSPFSGVTAGWSSKWVIRGTDLLLVLIVYGFGLGFLARVIRVRV